MHSLCRTINLSTSITVRCKQFYELFMATSTAVPTVINVWKRNHPEIADRWECSVKKTLPRSTAFLLTTKNYTFLKITNNANCASCNEADSIEHLFLGCCSKFLNLLDASLHWFNLHHRINRELSPTEVLLSFPF